ncbi:N-acetylmuramoyl-L-alanine amidase [Ruminococcaceae bacterium OttesenSCG-928-D13]|nr:N-acetylmuramoyl-L-alanine amidase [Ruminococcaceae bacterium OttesenSCG-928-D13]
MSNSTLASYVRLSPNRNSPRKSGITVLTPHHQAGNLTAEQIGAIMANSARQMSAHYAIESSGRISRHLDEGDRSWCSSSPDNDHRAITIEVANDGGAPDWHVSDKALNALLELSVDICRRNGMKKVAYTGTTAGGITRHNMFAATLCPGPYLQSKLPWLEAEVNKRLIEGDTGKEWDNMLLLSTGTKNMQGFAKPDANSKVVYDRMPNGYRMVTKRKIKGTDANGWEWVELLDERTSKKVYTPILPDRNRIITDYPTLVPLAAPGDVSQADYDKVVAERDAIKKRGDKAMAYLPQVKAGAQQATKAADLALKEWEG